MKPAVRVALVATALAFACQYLTVRYNFGGNWTALFCTGSDRPVPPRSEFRHTYIFQNSGGYDCELYRYLAHDPFFQRGLAAYVDSPRLRAPRILVPLLAWTLALGRPDYVDTAYYAVILVFLFLGVWCTARFVEAGGASPWWAMGLFLVPGVVISLNRMTIDLPLAALACAWAYTWGREKLPGPAGYLILAVLPLARDTGLLISLATVAVLVWKRQVRAVGYWVLTMIPYAAWSWYVSRHSPEALPSWIGWPLAGWLTGVLHPPVYPASIPLRPLVSALDYVALAGMLLAVILAIVLWWRRREGMLEVAIMAFAAMTVLVGRSDVWGDSFGFGRIFSPLLMLLALRAVDLRKPVFALPLVLVAVRVTVEFTPQLLGVLHLG